MKTVSESLRELRERAGLSRDQLGRRMGGANGKFLQRYEDAARYSGEKLPLELVAKLASVLVNEGSPKITADEIWGLAKPQSGVTVLPSAVTTIPLLRQDMFKTGRKALETAQPEGVITVAAIAGKNCIGMRILDGHCAMICPPGGVLIVDCDDCELRDGRVYLVAWGGGSLVVRYRSNPAHLESLSIPPASAIFPAAPVEVIGRALRCITDL